MNPAAEARRKLASVPADLRFAVMFAPRGQRDALAALFAVYLEIREIPHECSDPAIARTKLGWWQDEIGLLAQHQPRHLLSKLLDECTPAYPPESRLLLEIVESVATDISAAPFLNFEDVERYCYRRGGALMELAAQLGGPGDPNRRSAARLLGQSWQLADIVLNGLQHAQHGRNYFAAADLRKHDVDRHVMGDAHSQLGVQALLKDYAQRSLAALASAMALEDTQYPALTSARVLSGIAAARLRKFERRDYSPAKLPVELRPFARLLTAWRSARHAQA